MTDNLTQPNNIAALVLSGGLSSRMGGADKALIKFAGKPMIDYVLESLNQHIASISISTNSSDLAYNKFNLPKVPDLLTGNLGPLAGIHAGLHNTNASYLLITPCDCPFLETRLSDRLALAMATHKTPIAVAHDGHRSQNTFALIDTTLRDSLSRYLNRGGRRLITWLKEENAVEVDCSDSKNSFININSIADLHKAERLFAEMGLNKDGH